MCNIAETKVESFLRNRLQFQPHECRVAVGKVRALARAAGHDVDHTFAHAGLGSGPEGRLASSLVQRALGGGGSAVTEQELKTVVQRWLRQSPPVA